MLPLWLTLLPSAFSAVHLFITACPFQHLFYNHFQSFFLNFLFLVKRQVCASVRNAPVSVRKENTEVEQGSQGLLQGSANPGSIDALQHAHWHACISQLLETFKRDVLIHEAAQNLFTLN